MHGTCTINSARKCALYIYNLAAICVLPLLVTADMKAHAEIGLNMLVMKKAVEGVK